MGHYSLENA
ncbi:hypothetical protein VCEDC020_003397A, partial [Vibrio cholerae O1 str. EDC-020]